MKKGIKTEPGRYYGRLTPDGPLVPAPDGPYLPDSVICRRIRDFPKGLPPGAAVAACLRCGAAVAFNPNGPHPDTPRVCMQCCGIQPLPFDGE